MLKQLFTYLLLLCAGIAGAQYAPQAGVPGSTAIPAASTVFMQWATSCRVHRGYLCIDTPALGKVTNGDSTMALGLPDHSVVSLGDSGVAELTFSGYLFNGPGADFAVFENGFIDPSNDSQAFLELAFVEVSSDGEHFFRFPARSLTQNNVQIRGSGDYMFANLINNLAGKYGAGFGTPFNLDELSGISGLDINKITSVRIVDVTGSIGANSCKDSAGSIINDPFPTNFPTGGFDLDAVGAIHFMAYNSVEQPIGMQCTIYPNPCNGMLKVSAPAGINVFTITGMAGNIVFQQQFENTLDVAYDALQAGIYIALIADENGNQWKQKVVKY